VALKSDHLNFTLIPGQRGNSILAWGEINQGDALRFAAAITAAKPIDEIMFYSPGGSLEEGMKIGVLIRKGGFGTRVPAGARCISACNFAFIGGVSRMIDSDATFEVHVFSSDAADDLQDELLKPSTTVAEFNKRHPEMQLDPDKVDSVVAKLKEKDPDQTVAEFLVSLVIDEHVKSIQQVSAQIAALIVQYLVGMRLSLDFLTRFADIPNRTPRKLTREEMREFNIVNNRSAAPRRPRGRVDAHELTLPARGRHYARDEPDQPSRLADRLVDDPQFQPGIAATLMISASG
jgi:hypothetical protein